MPSLSAANATGTLIVEQGCAPAERANFWLTMARMRPLLGSMAVTVPFMLPSASMAAARTVASSPSVMSPAQFRASALAGLAGGRAAAALAQPADAAARFGTLGNLGPRAAG